MIEVEYLAPPAALAPFISTYYLFRCDEPHFEDWERAEIAQYRYVLQGGGFITYSDGSTQRFHQNSLQGPRNRASRLTAEGPGRTFGIGLLPAGWAALTDIPADKAVNRVLDGRELFGPRAAEIWSALRKLKTLEEMAALVTARATDFTESAKTVPHDFIAAVDGWLQTRLTPSIESLEAATGLSQRQIERLCCRIYGAPPKFLVRKYRALRAANLIAHGQGDWQDFIEEGFYDQPHCIRELKEFTGMTPAQIRQHASRLSNKTFDRAKLGDQIPALSAQT